MPLINQTFESSREIDQNPYGASEIFSGRGGLPLI